LAHTSSKNKMPFKAVKLSAVLHSTEWTRKTKRDWTNTCHVTRCIYLWCSDCNVSSVVAIRVTSDKNRNIGEIYRVVSLTSGSLSTRCIIWPTSCCAHFIWFYVLIISHIDSDTVSFDSCIFSNILFLEINVCTCAHKVIKTVMQLAATNIHTHARTHARTQPCRPIYSCQLTGCAIYIYIYIYCVE